MRKEFYKSLFSLALPIAAQQFMLAVVSASDAIMLNFISQEKMAAVSLATQISFVQNLFLMAMTIGFSALAAQYFGKGEYAAVEGLFGYTLKITAGISLLFFLASLCAPERLMRLFTDERALVKEGGRYLRIVSPSYFLTGISQIYLCLLKNSGRAKKAGVIGSVCTLSDMVMNILLIVGLFGLPRMEIAGAAVSTTIARGLEVSWCILSTRGEEIKLRMKNLLKCNVGLRKDFWKYTTPVLGNELVWGIGFSAYSMIMGRLGEDAVAANAVANVLKNLVVCLCLGVANGGGILVGNLLGRGELSLAREYGRKLCWLALLTGIFSGGVLLACSPLILRFVGLSARASGYLKGMLWICSYYVIGKSINCATIAGIFCAGGDGKFGLACDAVVMWGITLPLGLLSAFVWELPVLAVYFFVSLDELCKLPAVAWRFRKYKWIKDLTRKEIKL